jgi:hypothetical protein
MFNLKYQKYKYKIFILKGGVIPYDLNSIDGRLWLDTEDGYNYLDSDDGKTWINSNEGKLWLRTINASSWLNSKYNGRKWLESQFSDNWLSSYDGYLWLHTSYSDIAKSKIESLWQYYNNDNYDRYIQNIIRNSIDMERDIENIYFINIDQFNISELNQFEQTNDKNDIYISIDNLTMEQILNELEKIFLESDNIINYNIFFKINDAIDLGGVSRQVYTDLLYNFFEKKEIKLIRNDFIPNLNYIPILKSNFPNLKYFNCQNGECTMINNLGTIIGYVLYLAKTRKLDIGFGFELEKYTKSLFYSNKSNINFLDNYCDEIKIELLESNILINNNDIHYENFPILALISHLITIYCNININNVGDQIDEIIDDFNMIDKNSKKLLKETLKNEIINQCPNYENNIKEQNYKIPLKVFINFISKFYEKITQKIYSKFIYEIYNFMEYNTINNYENFFINLFMDQYKTKESLINEFINKTHGNAKNKLLDILPNLSYEEIRKLLKFWSGSIAFVNVGYKIEFLSDLSYLPTASTCGYMLYIPDNNNDELIKKIRIAIQEETFELI